MGSDTCTGVMVQMVTLGGYGGGIYGNSIVSSNFSINLKLFQRKNLF